MVKDRRIEDISDVYNLILFEEARMVYKKFMKFETNKPDESSILVLNLLDAIILLQLTVRKKIYRTLGSPCKVGSRLLGLEIGKEKWEKATKENGL